MKRLASILCTGLLLVTATAALATNPTSNVFEPLEKGIQPGSPGGHTNTGGETMATATVIGSLPYTDSDNTCGHVQDYTASCGANSAPDLFYSYVPGANMTVDVSLCGSSYDTVLYIMENGVEIACNDDSCGLQSELLAVNLTAGRTYVFGVSGFSTNCGQYILNIRPQVPCIYACPAGSQLEGEPLCGANYVDTYNGGCNSTPAVFQDMVCDYLCAETGTYLFGTSQYRDTDWFRITVGAGNFIFDGMGDGFALQKLVIIPGGTCYSSIQSSTATNCADLNFTGPGTYYLWGGPTVFTGLPCGSRYWISVAGPGIPPCITTAVEPSTWGSIKNVYR
jgi:hypothetical protein